LGWALAGSGLTKLDPTLSTELMAWAWSGSSRFSPKIMEYETVTLGIGAARAFVPICGDWQPSAKSGQKLCSHAVSVWQGEPKKCRQPV